VLDFNAEVWREDYIFKPTVGNQRLREMSNDNAYMRREISSTFGNKKKRHLKQTTKISRGINELNKGYQP